MLVEVSFDNVGVACSCGHDAVPAMAVAILINKVLHSAIGRHVLSRRDHFISFHDQVKLIELTGGSRKVNVGFSMFF